MHRGRLRRRLFFGHKTFLYGLFFTTNLTKPENIAPKLTGEDGSTTQVRVKKPMSEWTANENTKCINNKKALNSLFTVVSSDKFQLISQCTSAKQAWEILQVT